MGRDGRGTVEGGMQALYADPDGCTSRGEQGRRDVI